MKFLLVPFALGATLAIAPPNVLQGDPSKLLMPFLGLLMAGIFPAISLTIGSIKSGGFSVQRIERLSDELNHLLNYLQALFVAALLAASILVVAEAVSWGRNFPQSFYTARIFNAALGVCVGYLLSALPKIRRTFSTLLHIAREIAIDEAATKVKDRMAKVPSIIDRFPTKEKFGELFEATQVED